MSERQRNNTYPPPDAETQLKDAGLVASSAAAQVGGSDQILDFGDDEFRSGGSGEDGQAPYVAGDVVVDVTEIESGDGDEEFSIALQLSDEDDFGGDVVNRAILPLGASALDAGDNQFATGRYVLPVDNEWNNRTYRYARLYTHVAGTVGTGINYSAHLHKSPRKP